LLLVADRPDGRYFQLSLPACAAPAGVLSMAGDGLEKSRQSHYERRVISQQNVENSLSQNP